ncbi:hypothetical protein BKA93DRAFT_746224 [Sparassis latifolia]
MFLWGPAICQVFSFAAQIQALSLHTLTMRCTGFPEDLGFQESFVPPQPRWFEPKEADTDTGSLQLLRAFDSKDTTRELECDGSPKINLLSVPIRLEPRAAIQELTSKAPCSVVTLQIPLQGLRAVSDPVHCRAAGVGAGSTVPSFALELSRSPANDTGDPGAAEVEVTPHGGPVIGIATRERDTPRGGAAFRKQACLPKHNRSTEGTAAGS